MSAKHLTKGSQQPPTVAGKLRLYSMEFCPYAQRVRLVLLAKNVPHDIVNVHLKKKPEWIFNLHPEGKVPSLDTGSQVVIESLDISDFLDETYPEPPLYRHDQSKRQLDRDLILSFDPLIRLYYKMVLEGAQQPLSDHLGEVRPRLEQLEKELEGRGVYFGGDKPGMPDYMLWPWAERASVVKLVYNEAIPDDEEFPRLYAWCKAMRTDSAVRQMEVAPERYYKLLQQYWFSPDDVDYDII